MNNNDIDEHLHFSIKLSNNQTVLKEKRVFEEDKKNPCYCVVCVVSNILRCQKNVEC